LLARDLPLWLFLFEQFYVSMNCARFAEARYGLTSGPPQSYYGHFFFLVRTFSSDEIAALVEGFVGSSREDFAQRRAG
jgi:hypothetical protein